MDSQPYQRNSSYLIFKHSFAFYTFYCTTHERTGVVLAVNARVLAKDSAPFDSILKEHPAIQLLVWTATGEPPISGDQISGIKEHFHSIGCEDQLGFDCQVSFVLLKTPLMRMNHSSECLSYFLTPYFETGCIVSSFWSIL